MKINKITITGADNNTNIEEMVELTKQYPFVEWALLFTKNREGTQRYPSQEWLNKVTEVGWLPLSAHFCGWWAREVLENQNFSLIAFLENYQRVQLNYSFTRSKKWNLGEFMKFCKYGLDFMKGTKLQKEVILQYNRGNSRIIDNLEEIEYQMPESVNFLYDDSGGRGTVIESIQPPIKESYTGYAGGISDENIETNL
jgi:hypothetical protein